MFLSALFILAVIYTVWGQIILQNIFGDKCDKQGVKSILSVEANVDSKPEPENTNVVGAGNRATDRLSPVLRRTPRPFSKKACYYRGHGNRDTRHG